jgi:transcriptional regulator with XRE-family HTH domain
MGRASTKENKNRYHLAREELGLTREEAADLLKVISADRIEKIENERLEPQPYDVLVMSQGYKKPSLCNYYCSHECPIGSNMCLKCRSRNCPPLFWRCWHLLIL